MCGITCSKYQITISELQHRGNATINSKILIKSARLPQNLLSQRFKSMVESYKKQGMIPWFKLWLVCPLCINSRQVPHHLRQVLYQLRHLNYCKFIILCEYLISNIPLFCVKSWEYKIESTIFLLYIHLVQNCLKNEKPG